MSIATRIQAMSNHIRADYIAIRRLGVDLEGIAKNIENIASVVDTAYANLPKVPGKGSNLSLSPTRKGGLSITPLGACEQDTTAYIDVGTWEQGGIYGNTGQEYPDTTIIRTDNYIIVKPNVFYNISRNISTSFMAFRFYDNNKTILGTQATSGMVTTNQSDNRMNVGVSTMTMTINNTNVAYMKMVDNSNDLSTQYTISTQAPNPDYPQDIRVVTGDNSVVVQNKNLCPSAFQDNINILGSGNNRVVETYAYKKCQVIKVKPNTTYILSGTFTTSFGDNIGRVCMFNEYPIVNSVSTKVVTGNPNLTFTTEANTKYIVLLSAKANTNIEAPDLQLEAGSTATSYVEGKSQTLPLHLGTNYLAGIGDYKDEIVGKTDDWKIKRKVGKYIINGSEDWYKATTQQTVFYAHNVISNHNRTESVLCYSEIFKGIGVVGSASAMQNQNNNTIALDTNTTNNRIYINSDKFVDATDIDTFFTNNNNKLYYLLATPTDTQITDTTLITDLNNIYQAMGYDGTTNITIISDTSNAQMTASVSALKSLE